MDNDMSEEMIHQQMQETQASLMEKIELLENKVLGTVDNATNAVNETVTTLKETVQETMTTVQEGVKGGVEQVKEFVDVPSHVQQRPWLMLGGAVAVGYCLGAMTKSAPAPVMAPPQYVGMPTTRPAWMGEPAMEKAASTIPVPTLKEPSLWESEAGKLKGLALGVLFGAAREMLVSSLPEQMGNQIKQMVDSVTKKVGGEPLPSSEFSPFYESRSNPTTEAFDAESAARQSEREYGNGYAPGRRG